MIEVETGWGPAHVHEHRVEGPRGALVLGHGAGGGVEARDLVAVTGVANGLGLDVALVEQPYRVAGRRSPPRIEQAEAVWGAVLSALAERLTGPVVTGGRSFGARVACRHAAAAPDGLAGVLCLAFPVHPPGRPEKTRLPELDAVELEVLVVQGAQDPFGMPPPAPGRRVVQVPGNHSFSRDLAGVQEAVRAWLAGLPAF